MKETDLPISLSQVLCNVLDNDFRSDWISLDEMEFKHRRDFILTPPTSTLAVRMVFANELCLREKETKGVRRQVEIILYDAGNKLFLSAATVSVNIKAGHFNECVHAWLNIDSNTVNFKHHYLLAVRDKKTGSIIGEQRLRFFRQFNKNSDITGLLKPVYAGIEPNYSPALYKAFDTERMTYIRVRFNLAPTGSKTRLPFLPEMEIRTYFPDDTIESRFDTPVPDEDDAYPEIHCVSAPVYMTQSKKGVCYSELICFDIPIAGIVFNTEGDVTYGPWYTPFLDPLYEYSLRDTSERFKNTVNRLGYIEQVNNSDDDFERALEKFISSPE